nr:ABC transporter permease [uncultured Prevotella sp.]
MNIVWKLLRQHISLPQMGGFFFANLFGMLIVLLGYQFYQDVVPVFTAEDSFMKQGYLIVSKKVSTAGTISGRTNKFDHAETDELKSQKFVTKLGVFTSTNYKVLANMSVNGVNIANTELFFESIPDDFVDVDKSRWQYKPGDRVVPIILPKTYLTMYNFGFAQSHSLPKLSEGLVGMIDFRLFIQGNHHEQSFQGKVIGFSSRLSSILVPQSFMDWSNHYFSPDQNSEPTRLILEVGNPSDMAISKYFDKKGYELEDDKLNSEKSIYFLKLVVSMVMVVGLIISVLSFYILMLSIYLLVQKNSDKLENLLLIGYSPKAVAKPYQLLTFGLNVIVLIAALVLLMPIRNYYMDIIQTLQPDINDSSMSPSIIVGLALLLLVAILNSVVIRRKIRRIWFRKD